MNDQQKLLRVFRLIRQLSQPPYRTAPQLAKLLDTTSRTVYRYLQLLEEIGYALDKDERNRYFLILNWGKRPEGPFERDELYYLQELLTQGAIHDPIAQGILAKLHAHGTLIPAADSLTQLYNYQNILLLSQAITGAWKVRLCDYQSASSQTVSDRIVEPVEFADNYTYLWAYDTKHQQQRQFKIERIGRVELLAEKISTEHLAEALDIFGFSGHTWLPVRLKLSMYAGRLLLEEFPQSRAFVEAQGQDYVFKSQVRDWRGIGRFILGLPGEVEVLEPEELREYLQERKSKVGFRKT
jgi:proteasome accessory factor C